MTLAILAPAHAELRERLKGEALLNIDDSNYKNAGRSHRMMDHS